MEDEDLGWRDAVRDVSRGLAVIVGVLAVLGMAFLILALVVTVNAG